MKWLNILLDKFTAVLSVIAIISKYKNMQTVIKAFPNILNTL